jgi:hypothetical protein
MHNAQNITEDQYIKSQIRTWGEDHIFDLMDRGYSPIQVTDDATGFTKWTWVLPVTSQNLVNA